MSRKRVRLAALLIVGLLISACNSHTELPPDPQALIRAGKPLYLVYCAECHQPDGAGRPGQFPRLAGNPIVTLEDPIPIIKTVVNGQGIMPEFGDKLSIDQIAEILSYIRNAWGNHAPAVDSRQIP